MNKDAYEIAGALAGLLFGIWVVAFCVSLTPDWHGQWWNFPAVMTAPAVITLCVICFGWLGGALYRKKP